MLPSEIQNSSEVMQSASQETTIISESSQGAINANAPFRIKYFLDLCRPEYIEVIYVRLELIIDRCKRAVNKCDG